MRIGIILMSIRILIWNSINIDILILIRIRIGQNDANPQYCILNIKELKNHTT
jgi:hypothetical protein